MKITVEMVKKNFNQLTSRRRTTELKNLPFI